MLFLGLKLSCGDLMKKTAWVWGAETPVSQFVYIRNGHDTVL